MSKKIIITSDDFGLSHGVNSAVEKGWRDGILTNASLMPGGVAFDEAVDIAKRNKGLQIGVHLTLVHGYAVLPHSKIPDLISINGAFTNNPVAAGMRYFFDKNLYKQLRQEIEAQIQKVVDTGLQISHIDGHLNIHLHPTVLNFLVELMPQYGISSFRLSQERLRHNLRFDAERKLGKLAERIIFGELCQNAKPLLDELGIRYAGEVKGVLNSGRMNELYVLDIIEDLQEGLTELYFHPGVLPDEEITSRMPDYQHEAELAAIISPKVKNRLQELDIIVQNYRGEIKC